MGTGGPPLALTRRRTPDQEVVMLPKAKVSEVTARNIGASSRRSPREVRYAITCSMIPSVLEVDHLVDHQVTEDLPHDEPTHHDLKRRLVPYVRIVAGIGKIDRREDGDWKNG